MKMLIPLIFAIVLFSGCIGINISEPVLFNLEGYIVGLNNNSIEGAKVVLFNGSKTFTAYSNANGRYIFNNLTSGNYSIIITKEGYRNYSINFRFFAGDYDWNFTLVKDCIYYETNIKRDYFVRYGYNGTIYKSMIECELPYPENSYFNYSFKDSYSNIKYIGNNRVVYTKIDNLDNRYSSINFYLLIDMKGTNEMKIYERKGFSGSEGVDDGYLEERTIKDPVTKEIKKIVDPNNEEIRGIAINIKNKVMNETGEANNWDVAKEIFIWLKSNTQYFNQGGVDLESVQSPSELLETRKGDCDELSYLYISLLRSAGIPARYVEGFLVKENETRFVKHMWVEFYDGEWVPVEVAGTGNVTNEVNVNFGIERNEHIPIFIEDGTQASYERGGCKYQYYGTKPTVENYVYYTSFSYSPSYLAVCGDERYFTDKRE